MPEDPGTGNPETISYRRTSRRSYKSPAGEPTAICRQKAISTASPAFCTAKGKRGPGILPAPAERIPCPQRIAEREPATAPVPHHHDRLLPPDQRSQGPPG